jgi:hypothetical protein
MQENNEKTLPRETEIRIGQVLVLFNHHDFLSLNTSCTQLIVTQDYPAYCLAVVANFGMVGNTSGV